MSVRVAWAARSVLRLAGLARGATTDGNHMRVDSLHPVKLREVDIGHVAEDLALERGGDLASSVCVLEQIGLTSHAVNEVMRTCVGFRRW